MMRRVARGADDDGAGRDRLAADLADGGADVFLPLVVDSVHDRDPLAHPAVDAREQAVEEDEGLAHGLDQGQVALGEVAVDLDEHPLGVDRDQHAAGMDHPLEPVDRGQHFGSEEVAGHLVVVGLDDVVAVEPGFVEADGAGPARRLRRRGPAGGGQLEPEGDPLVEPGDDAGAGDLLGLARDRGSQPDPDGRAVVDEADRRRVAQAAALVPAAVQAREVAVGAIALAGHPGAEGGQRADEDIDRQDDQQEGQEFHERASLSEPRRCASGSPCSVYVGHRVAGNEETGRGQAGGIASGRGPRSASTARAATKPGRGPRTKARASAGAKRFAGAVLAAQSGRLPEAIS
jgi:hypothetical protein